MAEDLAQQETIEQLVLLALDTLEADHGAGVAAWELDTDPATARKAPAAITNAERAAAVLRALKVRQEADAAELVEAAAKRIVRTWITADSDEAAWAYFSPGSKQQARQLARAALGVDEPAR